MDSRRGEVYSINEHSISPAKSFCGSKRTKITSQSGLNLLWWMANTKGCTPNCEDDWAETKLVIDCQKTSSTFPLDHLLYRVLVLFYYYYYCSFVLHCQSVCRVVELWIATKLRLVSNGKISRRILLLERQSTNGWSPPLPPLLRDKTSERHGTVCDGGHFFRTRIAEFIHHVCGG